MTEQDRSLTYAAALYEAITQEMERDETVFSYGQGVDDLKGMYGTTQDLHVRFGADRNFDVPLSEDAMTGFGVGAALAGMRPINVHQRFDFLMLCMNQLVNMAAKMRYMFDGAYTVPMVVRSIIGRSWGQGAQHSQALHSMLMHVPGLKIFAPTNAYDAKGAMIAAIRDNNPVIFMEHRLLYNIQSVVPEAPYEVSFGKARTIAEGSDITLVGISHMMVEAARARRHLEDKGHSVELIDPLCLRPLDVESIARSVEKTGRLLVVDNGWLTCGASAEIGCAVMEQLGGQSFQFKRMGYADAPCPTTRPLEDLYYPNEVTIAAAGHTLITGKDNWKPIAKQAKEIEEFRGPF